MSDETVVSSAVKQIIPDDSEAKLRAFLQPIAVVLFIAIILSLLTIDFYVILSQSNPDYVPPDISPIPENPEDPGGIAFGALLNMLYYVGIAFIGGLIVFFIIKKGFMQFLVYFFAALMGFSWFTFGLFYGGIVSNKFFITVWTLIYFL